MWSHALEPQKQAPGEEVVVLSQILVNRVNYGYDGLAPAAVTHLNGERAGGGFVPGWMPVRPFH